MTTLEQHLKTLNQWRRGAEIEMPNPEQAGRDIDQAIELIESLRWRDVNVEKVPCGVNVILKNGDKYVGLGFFYDFGFESCDGSKFFKVKFTHWRPIETI